MKFKSQSGKRLSYSDPEWEYKLKLDEYETKYKDADRYDRSALTRKWNDLCEEKGWNNGN